MQSPTIPKKPFFNSRQALVKDDRPERKRFSHVRLQEWAGGREHVPSPYNPAKHPQISP